MTRIFTARFFRLTARDQAAVIEAALADIEKNYGRYITDEAERLARRRARRIWRMAATLGILKG